MTRVMHFAMRPPTWPARIWYRRLGVAPPMAESGGGWACSDTWVRLLPYRWRWLHWWYASAWGFYWIRCVLCDQPHGGHEGGATVPDPTSGPNSGVVICSRCTRRRSCE